MIVTSLLVVGDKVRTRIRTSMVLYLAREREHQFYFAYGLFRLRRKPHSPLLYK